jgi:hypothetical protein
MIDIKEIAKTMTRDEFIKEMPKGSRGKIKTGYNCPEKYDLESLDNTIFCNQNANSCEDCWRNAVKNIKFKDDMEAEKMSKELNIIEASNMPYGTEFKVKIDCYYKYDDTKRIRDNTKMIAINTQEGIRFKEYTDIEKASKSLINATFIPIQQPVSFMEVVNSDKKCRVEHPIINSRVLNGSTMNLCSEAKEMKEGKYLKLNWILYIIGYSIDAEMIRTIINEGKWYIEEQ